MNQIRYHREVEPAQLDSLLEAGYRHFGTTFFRADCEEIENEFFTILPLRIRLEDFSFEKKHRRILRQNGDLTTIVQPSCFSVPKSRLFHKHITRFRFFIPEKLGNFIQWKPKVTDVYEVCVYRGTTLIACSFFDVGEKASSGIYAMFDPEESRRSLGIYTLLVELEYSALLGLQYYYPGFAHIEPSFYDYKKQFNAMEHLIYGVGWFPYRIGQEVIQFPLPAEWDKP